MSALHRFVLRSCLPLLVCGLGAAAYSPLAAANEPAPLVVVVNKASPIEDLSLSELRQIFLLERQQWSDGSKLMPLNLAPESAERTAFDRTILRMEPNEVSRYWIDRKVRGQGGEPKAAASVLLVQRVISQGTGAIGYVRQNQLTDLVKPVRIGGLSYKDKGYPLWVDK